MSTISQPETQIQQNETVKTKVALVTGGSRGIGKACVLELARQGYHVAFSYVSSAQAAQALQQTLTQEFEVEALALQADARDPEANIKLVEQTMEKFGRLDALVNNAGVTRDTLIIRMKDDDWDTVIDTNLSSAFYTCRAAAKVMMKQRSGAIINITSVVGVHGNAGQVNYAASKAGLIGLTKTLAKELGSRGIRVNAVAPGFITTDMTENVPKEQLLSHISLNRLGVPEDIAKTVAFLLTSGDYITGQVIQVDGGLVM